MTYYRCDTCIQIFNISEHHLIATILQYWQLWQKHCKTASKKTKRQREVDVQQQWCVCVTGFFLFQAMLLTLRPLLSSQLKAQRRSTAGGRGSSVSSSICSTVPSFNGLSGSDTIIIFMLTCFSQMVAFSPLVCGNTLSDFTHGWEAICVYVLYCTSPESSCIITRVSVPM